MLRLLVLSLILANSVYFAWTSGLLRAYDFAPAQQSEPQRMTQQIKPEAMRILSAEEFKMILAQMKADAAPKECLQAGPFTEAQLATLRIALEDALPADAWQLNTVQEPARWIIYMGKYPNVKTLEKKRAELLSLKLSAVPVNNQKLEPGLSLGGFDSLASANVELKRLNQLGLRTARVVQENETRQATMLQLPAVNEMVRARLADLGPALAGKALEVCRQRP
jgi:hypothetical protein